MNWTKKTGRARPRRIVFIALIFLFFVSRSRELLFFSDLQLPFTLHFSRDYILLEPGEQYTLKINGILAQASFKSSRSTVASVTQTGIVYAWKTGRAIITATAKKQGKEIQCLVQVASLNHQSLELSVGESASLKIKGLSLLVFGVSYKSSDTSVATVSRTGKVRAVGSGTAIISVTAKGKTFECRVKVKE